jgi:DNA-binding NarL/FixJ family response regulator
MKAIRVILSCSSPIFCEGIIALLQKEADIGIVGKIDNGSQALKGMGLRPDVYILDPLLFKDEELLRIIHELKIRSPRVMILLLIAANIPDKTLMHYMMAGVDGYVNTTAKLNQLVDAIRTVHAGNIWADRKLLDKFVRYSPFIMSDIEARLSKLEHPLTKREKEIIHTLFLGMPNKHISQRLHISEVTVKTHLNNIFKKMNVHNRTQVVSALINSRW